MFKWIIEKYYGNSIVSTSKDGFETYNECLEDLLKYSNIDIAYRSWYEKEITSLNIKMEKVDDK